MKKGNNKSESENLRQKAEKLLNKGPSTADSQLSAIETVKLIHELEIHQIELELQNEELILERSSAKEAAEKYTELYDFAPSGYFTLSNSGEIIELNLSGAKMLGKERSRLKNSHFLFFVSKDTKPIFSLFLDKVFNSRTKEICEVTLLPKDNSPIYVYLEGIVTGKGEQCHITAFDITAHKKAEEALRESEEKYRSIFENIQDVYYETLVDGIIFEVSPSIEFMSKGQYRRVDLIGRSMYDFYQDIDDRNAIISALQKNGIVTDHEIQLKNQDGSLIDCSISAKLIFNVKGQPEKIIGSMHNITDRKQAEDKIRNLNENLEQRVIERTNELESLNKELDFHIKEIEQLTYIASHDLQEPLRTLTNFAQLFREDYAGKMDENGNKYIDFIFNSATRMRLLVTGLLDYSLLGQKSIMTMVDCNKIIREILSDMSDSINLNGAKITVYELPVLNCYETEMRLLFQNLIQNAIKFRKPKVLPEIKISAEDSKNEWVFALEDNGIGIEKKDKDKIFNIFQRTHNRSEFEGSGIGLAHCKKIVELHGGKIWVEPAPGAGSIFIFTIPKR